MTFSQSGGGFSVAIGDIVRTYYIIYGVAESFSNVSAFERERAVQMAQKGNCASCLGK